MIACSFDLETSGFQGNADIILCACIRPFTEHSDGGTVTYRLDNFPEYETDRCNDKKLAKQIYNHLKHFDIWVAHNGINFDDKFLRTRLAKYGIQMPRHKLVDPVRIARSNFLFGRNSLEQIANHFGIKGKNHVDMRYWMRAAFNHKAGEREAMDYIVDHCERDVVVLERTFNEIKYLVPKIDNLASYSPV